MVELGLQMVVERCQMCPIELTAPAVGDVQQARQATLPVPPEMVAYGVEVDRQGVGDSLLAPAAGEQDDCLDPIDLPRVARCAACSAASSEAGRL